MSYKYKGPDLNTNQSSDSGGMDSAAIKMQQEKKAKLLKKYRNTSIFLVGVIVVAVVLLLNRWDSKPPEQLEWSEWMTELPAYATNEYYNIEEQTLYRSRKLETTSSTTGNVMEGWELYDTVVGNGEFGAWSDWDDAQVTADANREVEHKQFYRYRNKETKTSKDSSLSGWTLEDTTYSWGEYGAWSSWTTSKLESSESIKVETKTQYSYRDAQYTSSSSPTLSGWTYVTTTETYGDWSDWTTTPISESDDLQIETFDEYQYTEYYMAHYCTGNISGAQYQTASSSNTTSEVFNQNCDFHVLGWYDSLSSLTEREDAPGAYRGSRCSNSCYTWYIMDWNDVYTRYYCFRPIYRTYWFVKYGDWSNWSDTAYSSTSEREVETRTVYRSCEREQVPTYHYWRWGGWSNWHEDSVSSKDTRQVETQTFYRYRDRQLLTTYYFQRWGNWSDYSVNPVYSDEITEVETIKQYRFISKQD